MIVSIASGERMYKTGLGAVLATHPEELNTDEIKFDIKQGYGNLHLFKTSYPWNYVTNDEMKKALFNMKRIPVYDTLFFVDEADDVFPARDYSDKEQKKVVTSLTQHGKLRNVIICTFQQGDPEDPLLGVDRILRSMAKTRIVIDYFSDKQWFLDYTITRLYERNEKKRVITGRLSNLDKYLDYWDTNETNK